MLWRKEKTVVVTSAAQQWAEAWVRDYFGRKKPADPVPLYEAMRLYGVLCEELKIICEQQTFVQGINVGQFTALVAVTYQTHLDLLDGFDHQHRTAHGR